ncbi:hypothetical protein J5N97_000757 [Dioscorea zingiberensis]|uniref:Uncharacterized protein n=1 Tax=Dioscorea zingiberensis TaxID=325984 RepID=A0A9D5BV21_9LILI|nr:hypothetical protein J5N97_000757 [Dioscorea zingiberensis]
MVALQREFMALWFLWLVVVFHPIPRVYANDEELGSKLGHSVYPDDHVIRVKFTSSFLSDLGNAELSGKLMPQLGQLRNLQYLHHEGTGEHEEVLHHQGLKGPEGWVGSDEIAGVVEALVDEQWTCDVKPLWDGRFIVPFPSVELARHTEATGPLRLFNFTLDPGHRNCGTAERQRCIALDHSEAAPYGLLEPGHYGEATKARQGPGPGEWPKWSIRRRPQGLHPDQEAEEATLHYPL